MTAPPSTSPLGTGLVRLSCTKISREPRATSARAGVAALIRGLNAIHHLPNRSGHWHQLRAIVLTFVLVGLVLAALTMAVVPLGEIGAKTYRVTGPWKSPKVEVVGREQSRARDNDDRTDRAGAP